MDKNSKHDLKVMYTFIGTLVVLSAVVLLELPWELSIIPMIILSLTAITNSPIYYWVCGKKEETEDKNKIVHIEDYL